MHIYLAGPLFTHAERAYLSALRDRLRQLPGVTVTWPADLFDDAHLASLGPKAKQHIFEGCRDAIHEATHVVALLDGTQVDDGTAMDFSKALRLSGHVVVVSCTPGRCGCPPTGRGLHTPAG